jgi:RNA polymerase sigma factor (sigma-70 family)
LSSKSGVGENEALPQIAEGARKRAAVETYVRHEATLRRTARRYSLCADDADDALQRALEILLKKAPSEDPRELIRWTQTVVKHEALAVRRDRERILSGPAAATDPEREDWVSLLPASADGPPERAERREAIARSREALQTLKPQELRALGLLAEGYSYAEIGELTGFSRTKINRCLAEGRERFRRFLARSEDGTRCAEMSPLLSAFCDGETSSEGAAAVREHLRACVACRAALRAYRAAPHAALSLAPALSLGRPFLERVHEALAGLATRLGGGGGDPALSQVAAGGGAGLAGVAKAVAVCAATAGGAAACVATGVAPIPLELGRDRVKAPALERHIDPTVTAAWSRGSEVVYEPAPASTSPPQPNPKPRGRKKTEEAAPPSSAPVAPAASAGAVEYAPPPAPTAEPAPLPQPTSESTVDSGGGDPAGEFGP